MRGGFRIGRLLGIEIRIDWSWLFVFALTVWNLGTVFGELHSSWDTLATWGTAVVAALLFFLSVLLHELAHSLVAKRRGVPVRNITLHLFGGVSNIQREPDSPTGEFLMAILGPMTSLVIGGGLLWISIAAMGRSMGTADPGQAIAEMGPLMTLVAWLGSVNVLVGLFNLLPGFPLDGGRLLRSVLWAATDDLRRATRWASWAGQGVAWLLILAGLSMTFGAYIPFLGAGLGSGLWIVFIGWFLNNAAVQSYQQVVVQDILEDVRVSRIMRVDPPVCSPRCTVTRLVDDHIMRTDDQAFPVIEDGELLGLVTLGDVREVSRDDWDGTTVRDIMTPVEELATVAADAAADEALNELTARDVRQLPVLQDGALVGLIRRRDIVKWLQLQGEFAGRAKGGARSKPTLQSD
jgi:Zn-dependent protease/CBS domain-containing protein